METVISAGKQVAMELPWSGGVSVGEGLRAQCSAIKERWERVWQATEQWGETLGKIHPEMEQFQVRERGRKGGEGRGGEGERHLLIAIFNFYNYSDIHMYLNTK